MSAQKIYIGDEGTAIILDWGQDITAGADLSIEVLKPNGTEVSWPAILFETTKLRFISLADTFDQAGDWSLQAKVTLPAEGSWLGETVALQVYAPFS